MRNYMEQNTETIELMKMFEQNIKSFSAKYSNSTRHNKDFHKTVDNILEEYYQNGTKRDFSEIFFNLKFNFPIHYCKACGKDTKFKNYDIGYKKYCSNNCASNDADRISKEGKEIGTLKRKEKMKILLSDPIKGPEYRRKISVKSKYYNNLPEEKERRSKFLKNRILEGKWTPNITNTWTHRENSVDGIPFRSSFEAVFHIYHNIFNKKNIKFEKLRIKYLYNNKESVYIVDFIDYDNNKVYEIKPKSLLQSTKNICKENSLIDWCSKNNFTYELITEDHLKEYVKGMSGFNHEFLEKFKRKYKW